jgi:hypothetical protein
MEIGSSVNVEKYAGIKLFTSLLRAQGISLGKKDTLKNACL